MKKLFLTALFLVGFNAHAIDLRGRMGVGATNQLANEIPALSFKLQQSKSFAIGGLLGLKSDQDRTLYGAGIKFYRIIFDEPLLNFYLAGLFATQNYWDEQNDKTKTGFQVDATLGSEFHFQGIESLGFSIEFGFSARDVGKSEGTSFETLGDNFIKAAIHFYL